MLKMFDAPPVIVLLLPFCDPMCRPELVLEPTSLREFATQIRGNPEEPFCKQMLSLEVTS